MRNQSAIFQISSIVVLSLFCGIANAQSGTKPAPRPAYANQPVFPQAQPVFPAQPAVRGNTVVSEGAGTNSAASALAMNGFCPVCIVEMKKWVRGDVQHQAMYDGKSYRFPSEKQKNMFLADPAKYAPALGGDCIVCFAKMNQRVAGSVQTGSIYKGRVYLFPDEAQRAEFRANPDRFVSVDVANGGKCAVCKVEMNRDMQGNPEIAAQHGGKRYFFPGEQQRQMFLSNPAKYADK